MSPRKAKRGKRDIHKKRVVFTAAARKKYLAALKKGHTHTAASGCAGVSYSTACRHREKDEEFGAAAEQAFNAGTKMLEDAAIKRATAAGGSDSLLIFALKQRGWSDRQHIKHEGTINFNVSGQWMDGEADGAD